MSSATTTVVLSAAGQTESTQLKNLQFVEDYAKYLTSVAQQVYTSGKQYVPKPLQSAVDAAEENVVNYGASFAATVQDSAAKYLTLADEQVETLMEKARNTQLTAQVQKYADVVKAGLDKVKEARVKGQESAVAAVEQVLDKVRSVNEYAAETAQQAVNQLANAWDKLLENETVAKAVEQMQPAIETAKARYMKVHDVVVSHQAYSKMWKTAGGVADKVKEAPLVKTASQKLYPYMAPLVDPILSSEYFQQAVQHVKPKEDEPVPAPAPPAAPTAATTTTTTTSHGRGK